MNTTQKVSQWLEKPVIDSGIFSGINSETASVASGSFHYQADAENNDSQISRSLDVFKNASTTIEKKVSSCSRASVDVKLCWELRDAFNELATNPAAVWRILESFIAVENRDETRLNALLTYSRTVADGLNKLRVFISSLAEECPIRRPAEVNAALKITRLLAVQQPEFLLNFAADGFCDTLVKLIRFSYHTKNEEVLTEAFWLLHLISELNLEKKSAKVARAILNAGVLAAIEETVIRGTSLLEPKICISLLLNFSQNLANKPKFIRNLLPYLNGILTSTEFDDRTCGMCADLLRTVIEKGRASPEYLRRNRKSIGEKGTLKVCLFLLSRKLWTKENAELLKKLLKFLRSLLSADEECNADRKFLAQIHLHFSEAVKNSSSYFGTSSAHGENLLERLIFWLRFPSPNTTFIGLSDHNAIRLPQSIPSRQIPIPKPRSRLTNHRSSEPHAGINFCTQMGYYTPSCLSGHQQPSTGVSGRSYQSWDRNPENVTRVQSQDFHRGESSSYTPSTQHRGSTKELSKVHQKRRSPYPLRVSSYPAGVPSWREQSRPLSGQSAHPSDISKGDDLFGEHPMEAHNAFVGGFLLPGASRSSDELESVRLCSLELLRSLAGNPGLKAAVFRLSGTLDALCAAAKDYWRGIAIQGATAKCGNKYQWRTLLISALRALLELADGNISNANRMYELYLGSTVEDIVYWASVAIDYEVQRICDRLRPLIRRFSHTDGATARQSNLHPINAQNVWIDQRLLEHRWVSVQEDVLNQSISMIDLTEQGSPGISSYQEELPDSCLDSCHPGCHNSPDVQMTFDDASWSSSADLGFRNPHSNRDFSIDPDSGVSSLVHYPVEKFRDLTGLSTEIPVPNLNRRCLNMDTCTPPLTLLAAFDRVITAEPVLDKYCGPENTVMNTNMNPTYPVLNPGFDPSFDPGLDPAMMTTPTRHSIDLDKTLNTPEITWKPTQPIGIRNSLTPPSSQPIIQHAPPPSPLLNNETFIDQVARLEPDLGQDMENFDRCLESIQPEDPWLNSGLSDHDQEQLIDRFTRLDEYY